MSVQQESLFSLEVVVEKLYLPYVPCRFPAVAFRLLDFPTILINHVEPELANRIKKKINIDPYYKVPNQFADLQDKHGNFLVKKGKSCLFKISVETLAMHLENTPMYIMVIDEFPEVPKLLGNSSLAMNEIVDAVKHDIRKNGMTVPSVQGDKGLFKIYSLMGKEIGYMIIGFRLLSLGPGLIAHLPATAIAKRASDKKEEKSKPVNVVEEMIEVKQQKQMHSAVSRTQAKDIQLGARRDVLNNTKEMGSMTDVEKCDALMQTVEMVDENIHVAISGKDRKDLKTIETQTEYVLKQRKSRKGAAQVTQKLKFTTEESEESDDGLVINQHLGCPPPLFYNKNSEPEVQIEKDTNVFRGYESIFDDATLEDLSGDEQLVETVPSVPKPKFVQEKETIRKDMKDDRVMLQDAKTVVISNVKKDENKQNFPLLMGGAESGFPLLNALLQELSKIQHPQLVNNNISNVLQVASTGAARDTDRSMPEKSAFTKQEEKDKNETEGAEKNISRRKSNKSARDDSTQKGTKQKGWMRKAPDAAVKKTKLVFGLTNTQRLRLAKQNPEWLKTAEQDEKVAKAQRQKHQKPKEIDADLDTGNLSDTFTEVRRLAAAELENTTMALPKITKVFKQKRRNRSRDKSAKGRNQSPSYKPNVPSRRKTNKQDPMDTIDSMNDDEAFTDGNMQDGAQEPKPESAADSAPSSRIEVHIPSARDYESEEQENTFSDSFENCEPSPDGKESRSKFPGFNSGEHLPDSILHDGNTSINSTQLDDDSPLESTRVSKQFRTVPGDTVFKSTEDYDTRQFHSTDEPELQNLISDDEKSESRARPGSGRSARSPSPAPTNNMTNSARLSMKFEVLNPTASQQSPLPALRRSQQLKVDSFNARPTPTDTPRSRSSQSSPKQPTPRARKPLRERRLDYKKESIHTESVSSYMPSESENILSLISDGSYSDDFQMSSEKDMSSRLSTPELPKVSYKQRMIPSTKLGFTIH